MKQFLQRIVQKIMKKKLETSEAWSMSRSSQRPSDPINFYRDTKEKRVSDRKIRVICRPFQGPEFFQKVGHNFALSDQ